MPGYALHKNTVETDQETSLIQAVYKYIKETDDHSILGEEINGLTVMQRLEYALDFLLKYRTNEYYGLIWGASTADWGDVQPGHSWGVKRDEYTTPAIDIYDNAMFLIALKNLIEMSDDETKKVSWEKLHNETRINVRKYLYDKESEKFNPHIYITCSPFSGFDENEIYYHGGTAVAIEAGLLSTEEILIAINKMKDNVQKSGAQSIGLTLYPTYPENSFHNQGMNPYSYQNGGDWTWFGGRMITQLVRYGYIQEAYNELQPFVDRVVENDGFFEWYTIEGKPNGSGVFRGSAGVLMEAIEELQTWAKKQ
jgi:glycogen debranching enzyme